MNNLFKSILFILLGMLLFIFSPQVTVYLVSFITGSQWDIAIWLSLLSWPIVIIGSLVLIFIGLRFLRIYFKDKKLGTEVK